MAACYSAERNMEMRTQPKDMVALTTLGLLSEQPCHPYEIQRLLKERHKSYAVGKPRPLYRAIEELEAAGYIEPVETSREGRRPERTVYRITSDGSEVLENWIADLLSTPPPLSTRRPLSGSRSAFSDTPPRSAPRPRWPLASSRSGPTSTRSTRPSKWPRTTSAFRGSSPSPPGPARRPRRRGAAGGGGAPP